MKQGGAPSDFPRSSFVKLPFRPLPEADVVLSSLRRSGGRLLEPHGHSNLVASIDVLCRLAADARLGSAARGPRAVCVCVCVARGLQGQGDQASDRQMKLRTSVTGESWDGTRLVPAFFVMLSSNVPLVVFRPVRFWR